MIHSSLLLAMTIFRRRGGPTHVDLPSELVCNEFPPLSALFLIYFDQRTGYEIGWKRSLPGVQLEGVVEYKGLPSGLHSVKHDLIYFVHGNYSGLSAFINVSAAEICRNARMIAVGVLVPHSEGRFGKCWKHAERLKEMASVLIVDTSMTEVLENYWDKYKFTSQSPETNSSFSNPSNNIEKNLFSGPQIQPGSQRKSLSLSDSSIWQVSRHPSSMHHPLWSMIKLLDTFGPLIFPIHRAALLRKRILITTKAPLQESCNFVYDISLLSNIPLSTRNFIGQDNVPRSLRPLFSIGVKDINYLEEIQKFNLVPELSESSYSKVRNNTDSGWIACTSDSILATKSILYDVIVNMPSQSSADENHKLWPKIEWPPGVELRATQRDFNRYKALRGDLSWHTSSSHNLSSRSSALSLEVEPTSKILNDTPTQYNSISSEFPDASNIIESVSWSSFAHSCLMRSTFADEQYSSLSGEFESDDSLLPEDTNAIGSILAKREMAIVTYFQRLTTQYFVMLDTITESMMLEDDQFDETQPLHIASERSELEDPAPIYISSENVLKMGLDRWSENDHHFINDLAQKYFGRKAKVESCSLEICGIRII